MKLSTTFRGQDLLFEGDLPLLLRAIPAGAQVTAASVTLTPTKSSDANARLFNEVLPIAADTRQGEFGLATQPSATGIIVDLGARRMIESLRLPGKPAASTVTVQLDMGGMWMRLDANGNPAQPGTTPQFTINPAGTLLLPNIAGQRLRLQDGADLTVANVALLSYPSNVTLRLGNLGPFWFRVGDLRQAVTTPDFADILQGFLDRQQPLNGVFEVPIIAHSDTLARLQLELNLEFYLTQALLPPALKEATYSYSYGALPNAQPARLVAQLPLNARALPGATSAQIIGRFEDSRVIHGAVSATRVTDVVRIKPGQSAAHPIKLAQASTASAIDVNAETVTPKARLLVTLLEDVDGKPWGEPLLKEPIEVKTERPAAGGSTWVSAPLPAEFTFQANETYWLVVNSAEGEVDWAVERIQPADDLPALQVTKDDGLSWRTYAGAKLGSNVAGVYRLRAQLPHFRQPIKLDVGGHEVSLRSLDALGKVDFKLELPEVADALNAALADAVQGQATTMERVANGDFAHWSRVARKGARVVAQPVALPNVGTHALVAAPNGQGAYSASIETAATSTASNQQFEIRVRRIDNETQPSLATRSFSIATERVEAVGFEMAIATDQKTLFIATYLPNFTQIPPGPTTQGFLRRSGLSVGELTLDSGSFRMLAELRQSTWNNIASDPHCRFLYLATLMEGIGLSPPANQPALARIDLINPVADGGALKQPEHVVLGPPGPPPIGLVISPNGKRAYVAQRTGIQVVDLDQAAWLGAAWHDVNEEIELVGLALSYDGAQVYALARKQIDGEESVFEVTLLALDVTVLEQSPMSPKSFASAIRSQHKLTLGQAMTRQDKTSSPMGQFDWYAMSVTPDDTRLLIGDYGAALIQVIDTTNPDTLSVLDPIQLPGTVEQENQLLPEALAVTPDSRRAFVSSLSNGPQIQAIELDAWTANDWALTGGRVAPVCVPEADKPTARLGSSTEATGLSQVFTVAGGQAYDLRFRARASDTGATAELFWLNDACGLLGQLSIDIQVQTCGSDLQPHTLRGTAPQAATRAELRFRQPVGEYMLLDDVSLAAPGEATLNSNFKTSVVVIDPVTHQPIQLLQDWAVMPDATVLKFVAEGVQLSATAIKPATLSQDVVLQVGKPFALHLQAYSADKPSPKGNATAELRWVGSAAPPIKIELNQKQFDKQLLSGSVPADATGATLAFTQPPGGTLTLVQAQLSQPVLAEIPITILSEAPGQVSVGAPVVAFDVVNKRAEDPPRSQLTPSPAPSPVSQPLGCKPTPPDDVPSPPGGPPKPGEGTFVAEPAPVFCPCCEGVHHLEDAEPLVSEGGMSGAHGTCSNCGAEITGFHAGELELPG